MTHNDYTKLMLNIKDDNIYFYDNLLTIENIKGVVLKFFMIILLIFLNIVLNVVTLMKVLVILLKGKVIF